MGRKKRLELTRVQAEGQPKWRKIHHGKIYTFRGKYEDAVAAWHRTLVELEASQPKDERHETELLRKANQWCEAHGEAGFVVVGDKTDRLTWRSISPEARAVWLERIRAMEEVPTTIKTIASAVDAFLVRQRAKVSASQITAGRYDTLQRCVNHFARFAGGKFGVNHINGAVLEAYHTHIMEEVGKNWSADYAQTYMIAAKQFIRWLDHNELIDRLPRNIDSKDLHFTIPQRKVKTFSVDEITTLLTNGPERTRLFLLMMLNIGATQKDISDLRPAEVDWTKGRIIRKRSKTGKSSSVPTIEYPLWKETFHLLQKFGQRHGERVLRNEDGGPLKVEELRDGKIAKIDNIAVAYHRLYVKLKKNKLLKTKKPLKLLRKTSPSLLQKNPAFAHCAAHFLGHAPRSIADKHYVTIDQPTFDKAVLWLGEQYGVK